MSSVPPDVTRNNPEQQVQEMRARGRRRAEAAPLRGTQVLRAAAAAIGSSAGDVALRYGYRAGVVTAGVGLLAVVSIGTTAGQQADAVIDAAHAASLRTTVPAAALATPAPAVHADDDAALTFDRSSVGYVSQSELREKARIKAQAAKTQADRARAADAEKAAAAENAEEAENQAVNDPSGARAYAASQLSAYGWGQDQMESLAILWTKESEWSTTATNASSGAYGIPQSLPGTKMAAAGPDWETNYKTQIDWGLGYIKERYGSPSNALGFHYANNWY